jgi:hypothetical protein
MQNVAGRSHWLRLYPSFGQIDSFLGVVMPTKRDLTPVFASLRSIMAEFEPRLDVIHDDPGYYYLNTRTLGPNKHPIAFGGVRTGKAYVSYYLMPVYMAIPEMSPALEKRMQGKACFNFTAVDEQLFDELRTLTRRGYDAWKSKKWVD